MSATRRRFAPEGHLAIAPKAFGGFFDAPGETATHEMHGDVAVVSIAGPLMHRKGYFESYDAIKERVAAALASKPKAVLLSIDSPGGLVSGCMETSRELRAMAEAAKVPLLAHVEGQACSAAYAIACAASRIALPETAMAGSIGVVSAMYDMTAADKAAGLRVEMVTSGARKADGNPSVPITDEAIAATQGVVDTLADVFFEWVAEARPSLSVDAVRGLEAGVLLGKAAVAAGLADEVATLEQMIAAVSGALVAPGAAKPPSGGDARLAHRATKGGTAMDGAKLRKMLKLEDDATDEDVMAAIQLLTEEDEEPKDDAPPKEDEEEAAAKVALPLVLARLKALEESAASDAAAARAERVESDIAAGKIATADRETYLGLLASQPATYEALVKSARVVPVGRVAKAGSGARASVSSLDETDLKVKAGRALGWSNEKIKAHLSAGEG